MQVQVGTIRGLIFLLVLTLMAISAGVAGAQEGIFRLSDPSYHEMLQTWDDEGVQETKGVDILVQAEDYADAGGEDFAVTTGVGGNEDPVLLWQKQESWLEWEVEVPTSGLYNMTVRYYPLPGKRSTAQREIRINGSYPYQEAKRIMFQRLWADAYEPKRDNRGHDLRPKQIETPMWRTKVLQDADGRYAEPLLFYLEEGVNRIRMRSIKEPMAIDWIRVHSPRDIPTYAELKKVYEEKEYEPAAGATVKIQAERAFVKTDPTIRREYGSDPLSEPFEFRKRRLNEFGGWRWRKAGQAVTWKFTVPKTGLYKIGFRALPYYVQLPVHRTIMIDGKVPFKELQAYPIAYSRGWRMVKIADENGEPYLFYLTEGEHTLTMDVKVGSYARTVRLLEQLQRELSLLARQVVMLTGSNPDPNMQWDLAYQLPDLVPKLKECARLLREEAEFLLSLCDYRPNIVNSLIMSADQLEHMAEYPDTIPTRLEQFSSTQNALGSWGLNLLDQAMGMDYILVMGPEQDWPRAKSTAWERARLAWDNFVMSFERDYGGIGSKYEEGEGTVIDVWVKRGRSWAEIIKEMAEDSFTPETGIKVNVMVMPAAAEMTTLLFSAVAGKGPDVALGVNPNLPVEFAIRGGAVDLSRFPDYEEVTKRFRPGALIPFEYQGGHYALPENQDFTMLFYRIDILQELGLEPPDTWEDVYYMLSVLQQNGLHFYYPPPTPRDASLPQTTGGYNPFLFQNGGRYYTEDGYHSALDTPEALKAFKEWTGLYTNYRIRTYANFYNQMRTGEMPIGVANYWTYVLLSTAAPELTGWWKMEPMPGHRKPDGTIDRTTGGASQVAMILKDSDNKEAAWEFLKWWTGAEAQARFGTELEALLGVEARWNTANVEALKQLPWPQDDIEAIMEQWKWFREVPVVLGGYFTVRHVVNAWNRVVLEGWNPREALEEAVKDINRELRKKQQEFGIFIDEQEGAND